MHPTVLLPYIKSQKIGKVQRFAYKWTKSQENTQTKVQFQFEHFRLVDN